MDTMGVLELLSLRDKKVTNGVNPNIDMSGGYCLKQMRTGAGQLLSVRMPLRVFGGNGSGQSGEVLEKIVEYVLHECVVAIDDVEQKVRLIEHGAFCMPTRFEVQQHYYAGTDAECSIQGYAEILEINNPPKDKHGLVYIRYLTNQGYTIVEIDDLSAAKTHQNLLWNITSLTPEIKKNYSWIKRVVVCNGLRPWVYSYGGMDIIEDFALPYELTNDPVYAFGQRFVLYDEHDLPRIATCMGTRLLREKIKTSNAETTYSFRRIAYFSDGSTYEIPLPDSHTIQNPHTSITPRVQRPRVLRSDELWIDDAIKQFESLLTGSRDKITVRFTNGDVFVGKVSKPLKARTSLKSKQDTSKLRLKNETNRKSVTAQGKYYASATSKKQKQTMKGWFDFVPTKELPDVFAAIIDSARKKKIELTCIVLHKYTKGEYSRTQKVDKKWAGVFYIPTIGEH